MKLIGRTNEVALLQSYADSNQAEFIAMYGRRRVGKTFLTNCIANEIQTIVFEHKNEEYEEEEERGGFFSLLGKILLFIIAIVIAFCKNLVIEPVKFPIIARLKLDLMYLPKRQYAEPIHRKQSLFLHYR